MNILDRQEQTGWCNVVVVKTDVQYTWPWERLPSNTASRMSEHWLQDLCTHNSGWGSLITPLLASRMSEKCCFYLLISNALESLYLQVRRQPWFAFCQLWRVEWIWLSFPSFHHKKNVSRFSFLFFNLFIYFFLPRTFLKHEVPGSKNLHPFELKTAEFHDVLYYPYCTMLELHHAFSMPGVASHIQFCFQTILLRPTKILFPWDLSLLSDITLVFPVPRTRLPISFPQL